MKNIHACIHGGRERSRKKYIFTLGKLNEKYSCTPNNYK